MVKRTNASSLYPAMIVAIAVSIAATASAAAQDRQPTYHKEYPGTEAQQLACTPDTFRLCLTSVPSVSDIVACLKEHRDELSPDCRAVFDGQLK
jgi:hypothetical protein